MEYMLTLTPGSGIGSIIIGLVNALTYMKTKHIDKQLLVNLNKASSPGNVLFTCFLDLNNLPFLKLVDIPIKVVLNKDTHKHEVITPGDYTELWYRPETQETVEFNTKCDVFKSIWVMKPDIINYLNIHIAEYTDIDVCINIRRGDKITLEPHAKQGSIQEFIDALEAIPNVESVFHTSDDYVTYQEIKQQRPDLKIQTFCTPVDAGYFLKDLNEVDQPNVIVNHVRKFMKELEIMKRATWFIGTKTTNVGLMVDLMRKGHNNVFIY
jgi:hypothetical protein